MRLLHITGGAVAVAGGIILAILAINMVTGPEKKVVEESGVHEDPRRIAVYPLAVPYLLNPVGITILIIASDEVVSVAGLGLVLGLVDWSLRLFGLCQHRQVGKTLKSYQSGYF